jgi:ribosomal protein S14
MNHLIQKDKYRRTLHKKQEMKRLQYKSIIENRSLPAKIRGKYIKKLNKLPRDGSLVRIRNRCILTGRARAVYKFCKLSRICLRELAAQGRLMGISKSSW